MKHETWSVRTMSYDGVVMTDLIKEVGTQALAMVTCEPFIQWVLDRVPLVIEHYAAAIALVGREAPELYCKISKPSPQEFITQFRRKIIESVNKHITPPLEESNFKNIILGESNISTQEQDIFLVSFYCVPLIVRGNILGVFAICSREADVFLAYRLNLFNVFAGQVALAIDSLKAREQVVKQARIIERDSKNMKVAFSGMSDGLVMIDESDELILINPVARQMLGFSEDEAARIPKDSLLSLLAPLLKDLVVSNTLFVGKEMEINEPYKLTLRADATSVKDTQGTKMGTVVLLRDITAEKELEKMKSEFVSTVSHELRTPLTVIREAVSQVLDGILGPTTDEQKEFLSICLTDIDRLTRIINDLLDMSKIEAKRLQLKREVVDIVELVKGISTSFHARAKEKGLEIKTNFSDEKIEAFIDRDKIVQVFTNLVGNSLKFTTQGYIEITVSSSPEVLECVVADTGRGIADDDISKVFSKFQQFGRESGPGEKGTGLGLSIAKGIVELHYGKIRVESTLNKGTRFVCMLPNYVEEDSFCEIIDKMVFEYKKDNREFIILRFSAVNYAGIRKEAGEKNAERMFYELLKNCVKATSGSDLLVPLKGAEIAVVSEVKQQHSTEIIRRFENIVKESVFRIEGREIPVDFSFGCSVYPADGDIARELLSKAQPKKEIS